MRLSLAIAGFAFADGNVSARSAQADHTPTTQQTGTRQNAFPSAVRQHSVWVYGQFRAPGYTQGGEN